jgi:hypothetical protein
LNGHPSNDWSSMPDFSPQKIGASRLDFSTNSDRQKWLHVCDVTSAVSPMSLIEYDPFNLLSIFCV